MKLVCTKKGFAQFIRECERIRNQTANCGGCVMNEECGEGYPEENLEFELVEDEE